MAELSVIERLRRASRTAVNKGPDKSPNCEEAVEKYLKIDSKLVKAIDNAIKTDSVMAAQLIVDYILFDIGRGESLARRKYIWIPTRDITTELQGTVVSKLRRLDLTVKSYCGRHHPGWITNRYGKLDTLNCDGRTYSTCWREVSIVW